MTVPPRVITLMLMAVVSCGPRGVRAQPTSAELWTLGTDGADGEAWFQAIGWVAHGPAGTLLVADPAVGRVAVVSETGELLRWLGNPGRGPGEFATVSGLYSSGDTVFASDGVLSRTVVFLLDGSHVRTQRFPETGSVPIGVSIPLVEGATVQTSVSQFVRGSSEHFPREMLLIRWSAARIDTIVSFRTSGAMWGNRDRATPWGVVESGFGKAGGWAVLNDSTIVWADGYSGEVSWLVVRDGSAVLVERQEVGLDSRPVTDGDLDELEDRLRDSRPGLPRRVTLDAPPRWSVASSVLADTEGNVWVKTGGGQGEVENWSRFRIAGSPAECSFPPGFQLRLVSRSLFVGQRRSELDAPLLVALPRDSKEGWGCR